MFDCVFCLFGALIYYKVSGWSSMMAGFRLTSQACNQLKTSLKVWWRFDNVCRDEIVQIGIDLLFQSSQEGIANPINLTILGWGLSGRYDIVVRLKCLQRILVQGL